MAEIITQMQQATVYSIFYSNYRVAMQPRFGNPEVTHLNKRARHLKFQFDLKDLAQLSSKDPEASLRRKG